MVTWEWGGGDEICVQGYGGPPQKKEEEGYPT